jgi:hypothetical protein
MSPDKKDYVQKQLSIMRDFFTSKIDESTHQKINGIIKSPFVLFPFQLATDFNLKYSRSIFSKYYSHDSKDNIQFAQACIDYVENSPLNIPIIFKQHPSDRNILNGNINIGNKDSVLIENDADISSISLLSSPNCKLVVGVNSNTLHEALVFGVPIVALGTLLWNDEVSPRPFLKELNNVDMIIGKNIFQDEIMSSYLYNLFSNQWFLTDFQNPLIVKEIISSKASCVPWELRQKYGFDATR